MKLDKLFILYINQKKLLKKYTINANIKWILYLWTQKIVKLTDKIDLWRGEKSIALSNLNIYYTWKNIKSSYNNNEFKISAPTWNDKFELPNGLYSISNIQDYFEYILKKHGENIDKPSVKIYMKIRQKTELHLKLKMDTVLNF